MAYTGMPTEHSRGLHCHGIYVYVNRALKGLNWRSTFSYLVTGGCRGSKSYETRAHKWKTFDNSWWPLNGLSILAFMFMAMILGRAFCWWSEWSNSHLGFENRSQWTVGKYTFFVCCSLTKCPFIISPVTRENVQRSHRPHLKFTHPLCQSHE